MDQTYKLNVEQLRDLVWVYPYISDLPETITFKNIVVCSSGRVMEFEHDLISIIGIVDMDTCHYHVDIQGITSPSIYCGGKSITITISKCLSILESFFERVLLKGSNYSPDCPVRNYPLFQLLEVFNLPYDRNRKGYSIRMVNGNYRIEYLGEIIFNGDRSAIAACMDDMISGTAPESFYHGYIPPPMIKSANSRPPNMEK